MSEAIPTQRAPYKVSVEAGRNYAWCACGRSAKQPFCDGSHKDTGLSPIVFKAEESKDLFLCGCKQTKNGPYCDGTHGKL